jgi:YcxB-like protein
VNLPGPITYRIDEASHYALWKLMFRRSLWQLIAWTSPIIVFLGLIFFTLNLQSVPGLINPIYAGFLIGVVIAVTQRLTLRSRALKVYGETASFREEVAFHLTDQGFKTEQPSGIYRANWADMVRWDEDTEIFAIFPNRDKAVILPKDQFSVDVVLQARERMVQSGLPRPGKLRK